MTVKTSHPGFNLNGLKIGFCLVVKMLNKQEPDTLVAAFAQLSILFYVCLNNKQHVLLCNTATVLGQSTVPVQRSAEKQASCQQPLTPTANKPFMMQPETGNVPITSGNKKAEQTEMTPIGCQSQSQKGWSFNLQKFTIQRKNYAAVL